MNSLSFLGHAGLIIVVLAGCQSTTVIPDGATPTPEGGTNDIDAATDADVDAADAADGAPDADTDAAIEAACVGTTFACWGRDPVGCALGIGCVSGRTCLGTPSSCPTQPTEPDCVAIGGCTWNVATSRCLGGQTPCNAFSDELSCEAQPGCAFAHICSGRSTPCGELDAIECEDQLGCSLPSTSRRAIDARGRWFVDDVLR